MNRRANAGSEYCPHRPDRGRHDFDAGEYWINSLLSIHVRDFQSTFDGVVAYAVFFFLLFLSSLVNIPAVGLAELYRDSLLRTGLVTVLALVVILFYARFVAKRTLRFGTANAEGSLLASPLALLVWGSVWAFFGQLSRTYHLVLESTRIGLVPLALSVGVLDGLAVYAYCTERFVSGVGRTLGILISSLFAWLLLVAASIDFALYLLPILIVLGYVTVRTRSSVGPSLAMGPLLAFFFVYFGESPWMLGSRQVGYWLMTAVSVVSAFVAVLSLRKIPLGGAPHGEDSAI